jgi:TATA-box binding protein (TBP) (component of TFIID and TFIIIB)
LARDYAIQAHKHEKQSEIAIRKMVRKLTDMNHTVAHEDQAAIQNTIDRLQRIRDDLLAAMFPKVGKK